MPTPGIKLQTETPHHLHGGKKNEPQKTVTLQEQVYQNERSKHKQYYIFKFS